MNCLCRQNCKNTPLAWQQSHSCNRSWMQAVILPPNMFLIIHIWSASMSEKLKVLKLA